MVAGKRSDRYNLKMNIRNDRREAAIERMADYLLIEGLEAATLRPLATAAGTSNRMLLYYFADRDELLASVMQRIATRLATRLDAVVPLGLQRSFATLLDQMWVALQSEELKPYMNIWLDLSVRASGGRQPYCGIAGLIADSFLAWAADRLDACSTSDRREAAALLIAALNGLHVLETIGRGSVAGIALSRLAAVCNAPLQLGKT